MQQGVEGSSWPIAVGTVLLSPESPPAGSYIPCLAPLRLPEHPHLALHPKFQGFQCDPLLQTHSLAPNVSRWEEEDPPIVTRTAPHPATRHDLAPFPGLCIARGRPDPALWGEPSPPKRCQAAVPTTPAWLCRPQTLPKPPSQQERQQESDPPLAPTHRPRHRPGHDLSLTCPGEFQGRGASPGSARSSPDTTLGASSHGGMSPRWLVPTAGISAANQSDAPKSIGVRGAGAGRCQLDPG